MTTFKVGDTVKYTGKLKYDFDNREFNKSIVFKVIRTSEEYDHKYQGLWFKGIHPYEDSNGNEIICVLSKDFVLVNRIEDYEI